MSGVPAEQDDKAGQRAERRGAKLCLSAPHWDFRLRKNRSSHLWRSDRSDLVADQLPAARHFYEDDAALELAAGGFAAGLTFQRHPIDRARHLPAVNPDLRLGLHFNGAELGSP